MLLNVRSLQPNQVCCLHHSKRRLIRPVELASPPPAESNDVPQCCTLTLASVSAALYPFIDACLASIPALIGQAIHYPSVCFSGLLNDLSD